MGLIDEILEKLKPYEDKVLIFPLTDDEVELIQAKYKKKLPEYFKEFLLKIGLKQNLVFGINENRNRFEDISEFIGSEDYFQFGDNGGEDYWLLKFEDENYKMIYEYDHYCNFEIVSLYKTFDELLLEGLKKIEENYKDLALNKDKKWRVQFCLEADDTFELFQNLKPVLDVKLLKEVEFVDTSEAGVSSYEGQVSINGRVVSLSKQSFDGWLKSSYYFDLEESVAEMKNDSFIRKIDKALSDCALEISMVDYGVFWWM